MPTPENLLALLRAHGRTTTSFQTLEPSLSQWTCDAGCVVYADTGSAWVAACAPLAAVGREADVMTRFAAAARAAGKRPRFFGLEDDLADLGAFDTLCIGLEPVWDPRNWPGIVAGKRSLREQLRRARAKQVVVRHASTIEFRHRDATLRRAIERLERRWLATRRMAPMAFVARVELFGWPDERLYLVAERAGQLVGLLVAVPIYARNGWLLEDTLRDPTAPNGTVELLVDHAMRSLAVRGAAEVTFGLAPLAGVDAWWLRYVRDATRWVYDFEGLRAFKSKLEPDHWRPIFLGFRRGECSAMAILDVLRAFAGGSLFGFGCATLVHRAPGLTWLLGWLLVPWTAVLATVDTEPWFPSSAVQRGWIAVDALLFIGLLTLASRWSVRLATLLAIAAATDFVAGSAQAVLFNLRRDGGIVTSAVVVVALAAPLAAAWLLWTARHRGAPVT